MDSDDIAETRAIAKIMLWKKQREELIDKSYNRYSFFDDENNLPDWFVEDESVAHKPKIPVTKEQIAAEKLALQEFNARPTKKVAEAQARKKKWMTWTMEKVRKQANVIAN